MSTSVRERALAIDIVDGVLRISIGIDTLALACERMESLNRNDPHRQQTEPTIHISDSRKFAKDVKLQLLDEDDAGATIVTEMLDRACLKAVETGSLAVDEVRG